MAQGFSILAQLAGRASTDAGFRRAAGNIAPTRPIASIALSAGMGETMPASAISAAVSALGTPMTLRYTHGTSTNPSQDRRLNPSNSSSRRQWRYPSRLFSPSASCTSAAAAMALAEPHSAWQTALRAGNGALRDHPSHARRDKQSVHKLLIAKALFPPPRQRARPAKCCTPRPWSGHNLPHGRVRFRYSQRNGAGPRKHFAAQRRFRRDLRGLSGLSNRYAGKIRAHAFLH